VALPRSGDPLLDEPAAQIGVDKPAFGSFNGLSYSLFWAASRNELFFRKFIAPSALVRKIKTGQGRRELLFGICLEAPRLKMRLVAEGVE
jgi:hypothetical protein